MDYYLELCSEPIRFDSVSQLTTVFFDDSNKQVKCLLTIVFLNSEINDILYLAICCAIRRSNWNFS